ncbi:hypothetical protein [Paenibacillus sp. GYB003]|uniref:hypothetical protein n=1 Tax=Paenibacillus sp. GYB003 TaxID=2994392 RepID=UPI002F969A13
MKLLQEQIHDLELENRLLIRRLEQLEQRLPSKAPWLDEAAAARDETETENARESPAGEPAQAGATLSADDRALATAHAEPVLLPRSVRHPVPKRTFWGLFRFRSRT